MGRTFEKLEAWKYAIKLATQIYEITKKFPEDELYGITSQIRRAIISISSNIAEGSGVNSKLNYIRHLKIANGSLYEVESLLIVAHRLGYIKNNEKESIINSIEKERKLLYGLITYLHDKD
jgi:four helix bundle protein